MLRYGYFLSWSRFLVPFGIAIFHRLECGVDRSRIKSQGDVVDTRKNRHGNIFTGGLEDAGEPIGKECFIVLTNQDPERLPDCFNVRLIVLLGPEVLGERERIRRRKEFCVFLREREAHYREVVEQAYSESIEDGDGNEAGNSHPYPAATIRARSRRILAEEGRKEKIVGEEFLPGIAGESKHKTSAGRKSNQGGRPSQFAGVDKVFHVVLQLSHVGDATLRAGVAVSANIQSVGVVTHRREPLGHHMDAAATRRRAMHECHTAFNRASSSRVESEGELYAIASCEGCDFRQIGEVHALEWVVDTRHGRRRARPTKGDSKSNNHH